MREGESGPTPAGKTLPHSYPETRLRRERGHEVKYGHTHSKSMDQPGKVANPARGQLNRENNIPLSAFVPENLVSIHYYN